MTSPDTPPTPPPPPAPPSMDIRTLRAQRADLVLQLHDIEQQYRGLRKKRERYLGSIEVLDFQIEQLKRAEEAQSRPKAKSNKPERQDVIPEKAPPKHPEKPE